MKIVVARMKADFGSFGGKHIDNHDCPGAFTSMLTWTDVADDEHPGVFIVGDLGVVIGLSSVVC